MTRSTERRAIFGGLVHFSNWGWWSRGGGIWTGRGAHSGHVVPVGLERIAWGFALPDLTRIHQGTQTLIFTGRAEAYGDSIRTLVRRFADRWGAGSAVVLLDNAEDAHWSRNERDRLLMTRAWLAYGGKRSGGREERRAFGRVGRGGAGLRRKGDAGEVAAGRGRAGGRPRVA